MQQLELEQKELKEQLDTFQSEYLTLSTDSTSYQQTIVQQEELIESLREASTQQEVSLKGLPSSSLRRIAALKEEMAAKALELQTALASRSSISNEVPISLSLEAHSF